MSPWLTTKHQNSQQSPGRNFNKLRLFWKEVGLSPISRFPLQESRLFVGRLTRGGSFRLPAQSFLLNPPNHVRRTILDGDISRFNRTKKLHCLAIDKRYVCEVK